MPCETKSPSNWFLCYNLYAFCYSIYIKLSCNFIKMCLRGKCPLVNLLHIFGTPIRKYTTGGLLVGGMISMSTFLAWIHVKTLIKISNSSKEQHILLLIFPLFEVSVKFDRISTVLCQGVFYLNLFSSNINVIKYYDLFTWLFCKVFIRPWLEYHTWSILLCSHGT